MCVTRGRHFRDRLSFLETAVSVWSFHKSVPISNLLPQGEAGYAILRASPVILVRYRSHDAADTGIRFAMEPRNRTTTDDLLNELRGAIDELISASEGNGEDLVRELDEVPRYAAAGVRQLTRTQADRRPGGRRADPRCRRPRRA